MGICPFPPINEPYVCPNPVEVFRTALFGGPSTTTIPAAFPATNFSTLVKTPFHFSVTRGRVTVSDIVLWYQLQL